MDIVILKNKILFSWCGGRGREGGVEVGDGTRSESPPYWRTSPMSMLTDASYRSALM